MGRSTTPAYRIEMRLSQNPGSGRTVTASWSAWSVKYDGRPTPENLERYVMRDAKSHEFGGVNHRNSVALGYVPYITWARIVDQRPGHKGEVVAEWQAAQFQAYGDLRREA
jgi:hypothetical protein